MNARDEDLEVVEVPLASLKAYDGNAKKHDNANVEAIESSIKEFGFRNPILAWHNEDGVAEIVAGHGRALAAQKLGIENVPCIFVDDLSDAQRRMLTLADNQTTLMTGWDMPQLEVELDALGDVFDLESFGFDQGESVFGTRRSSTTTRDSSRSSSRSSRRTTATLRRSCTTPSCLGPSVSTRFPKEPRY